MHSPNHSQTERTPLTFAERRAMSQEYAQPGHDERVTILLAQLDRAEAKIAEQARDLENFEARLSRRAIDP